MHGTLYFPPIDVAKVRELAAQGLGSPTIARQLGTTRGRIDHCFLVHKIPRNGRVGGKRKEFAPRPCGYCGQLFERGTKEAGRDFLARKFCSLSCAGHARQVLVPARAWTQTDISKVKEMVTAGLTAREIAGEFKATRNAIIGLARRHGFRLNGGVVRPRVAKPKVERPRIKMPKITDADIPFEQRVTFLQLEPHHCRWPIGDLPDMMFCGAAREGKSSYCAAHEHKAHNYERGQRLPQATPVPDREDRRLRSMRAIFGFAQIKRAI